MYLLSADARAPITASKANKALSNVCGWEPDWFSNLCQGAISSVGNEPIVDKATGADENCAPLLDNSTHGIAGCCQRVQTGLRKDNWCGHRESER